MTKELTKVQREFLAGIDQTTGFRGVKKQRATARQLEKMGLVALSSGGLFAFITDLGRSALKGEAHE